MTRPLTALLVATAVVFSAVAEAQVIVVGPNNPNPPVRGVSVMRPDLSIRPPRSFRDPMPAEAVQASVRRAGHALAAATEPQLALHGPH